MRRLLMSLTMLGAAGFLYWDYTHPRPGAVMPAPPKMDYTPLLSENELLRVRQSAQDIDPDVRWSAVELLFNIRDPYLPAVLERMMTEDVDPQVRAKVMSLYRGRDDVTRLGALVKGLADMDKGVRLASLQTLGDIGDPSVSVWIIAALRDPETEVRIEALRALGRFQEKRKADFDALAKKLKKDYEAALRRAKDR